VLGTRVARRRRPLIQPSPPLVTVPIPIRVARSAAAAAVAARAVGRVRLLPLAPPPIVATLMEAVVRALTNDLTVQGLLQPTASDPRIYADDAFVGSTLPYLLYTEPEDTPMRVFGGISIGRGEFEFGAFTDNKVSARTLITAVRRAVNGITVPQILGEGIVVFCRNDDNASREIHTPAPTPQAMPGQPVPDPVAIEFGRVMRFRYQISRSDP
jgi:hypothetical protein